MNKDDDRDKKKSPWHRFHERMKWGLCDHDCGRNPKSFYSVTAKGPKNPQMGGMRDLTDKQLMALILKMALDKGYTKLYFYRGNKIDPGLTQRASQMVQKMSRPGGALEGHSVDVSYSKMPQPEPWRGFVSAKVRLWNDIVDKWKEDRAIKKFGKLEQSVQKKL